MHINSTLEPQWNPFWKFLGGYFSNRYLIKRGSVHLCISAFGFGRQGLGLEPLLRALAPWLGGSFGLVWGLMAGLHCCASHGGIISVQGLAADSGSPGYFRHPTSILAMQLLNAFKCYLKELTTKSAWVPRSAVFGMRMPGGWLHRSCDSLPRSVFPSCWVLLAIFFPFRPPLGGLGFSPLMFFQCDWCLFLSFAVGAHGWVALLCQSWGIISIQGLAANSGSPWILQAPNLHFSDAVVNTFYTSHLR